MEDVRSFGKSSVSPAIAVVERQFAGSRVERQVLAQVFEVLWQGSAGAAPHEDGLEEASCRTSCGASRRAVASRITEGVAS